MFLLIILLLFGAQLQQSLQQGDLPDLEDDVKKEIVDMHNFFRRNVRPPARNMMKMVWNEEISRHAKRWASKCTGQSSPKNEAIVDGKMHGETIFQSNHPSSWSYVLSEWYNTGSRFKYGETASVNIYGPYTQMIWDRSRMIGCGNMYCPNNELPFYYVCRYFPTGNIENFLARPYKTGSPCEDCLHSCENKLCTSQCDYVDKTKDCKNAARLFGCRNNWMLKNCASTCKCKTKN